ncbi:5718_t:CDS:2, partial [Acaulospora morrowiae]
MHCAKTFSNGIYVALTGNMTKSLCLIFGSYDRSHAPSMFQMARIG